MEFRQDCNMWLQFLKHANSNKKLLCRPFIDFESIEVTSKDLNFYTDASKNKKLGFGAVYRNHWTFRIWENGYIDKYNPSIEYLELYALCVRVFCWGKELQNTRVTIFCDNQAVVQMVNNTTLSCKNCMYLIRMLVLDNITYNRCLFAKYVKSSDNGLADALSRQEFSRFNRLAPLTMDRCLYPLPQQVWPASRIWQT